MENSDSINDRRINKLKTFRANLGLNQKDFASTIGMNVSYYCRLENGTTPISDKTLIKIATTFNIPKATMLNDDLVDVGEEEQVDEVGTSTIEKSAHRILDEIIARGGRNNFFHEKEVSKLLLEIQYFLEYKDQYHDLSENEEKVLDATQGIIDILLGL